MIEPVSSALVLRALGAILGDELRIAPPRPLGTLSAIIFVADDLPAITVNDSLSPGDTVVQILHCYAHHLLGHLAVPFSTRLELPMERWPEQSAQLHREDQKAYELTDEWIRGRDVPPGLRCGLPRGGESESLFVWAQRTAHRAKVSSVLAKMGGTEFVHRRYFSYTLFRKELCAKTLAELAERQLSVRDAMPTPTLWAIEDSKDATLRRYQSLVNGEDLWVDDDWDHDFSE
jgi:hypothetical protein